jgi:hypothetical protein
MQLMDQRPVYVSLLGFDLAGMAGDRRLLTAVAFCKTSYM